MTVHFASVTNSRRNSARQVMHTARPLTAMPARSSVDNRNTIRRVLHGDGALRRKCAACATEEQLLQKRGGTGHTMDAVSKAPDLTSGVEAAIGSMGGGRPLPDSQRAFFESRFGRDLSGVRIHTDRHANDVSAAINARAFTLGSDIAFGRGEYAPGSTEGRWLMAHELTHVSQQGDGTVRRASYGAGTPPNFRDRTLTVVPADERERVDEAMAIIDAMVSDREGYSECHDHYAEHCPGGNDNSLTTVWNRARIWRITDADADENASGRVNGRDLAYTRKGYKQGAEGLAGTMLHELGHNCGIPGGDTHWRAAQIRAYCIGPGMTGRNELAVATGGYAGGEGMLLMMSYRRFLGDWANGRLRLTLGADVNLMGSALEGDAASLDTPAAGREPGEFASAMVGANMRLGGWGGPRYGGFSLRLETGFGAGRFAVPPSGRGDEPTTTLAPHWVLQIGPRAEFLIPVPGEATVVPISIGAAYRLAQPLNGEARALHGLMGSVEFRF